MDFRGPSSRRLELLDVPTMGGGAARAASVTGKPSGGDLSEHKASTVVVAAHQMADATIRRQLAASRKQICDTRIDEQVRTA